MTKSLDDKCLHWFHEEKNKVPEIRNQTIWHFRGNICSFRAYYLRRSTPRPATQIKPSRTRNPLAGSGVDTIGGTGGGPGGPGVPGRPPGKIGGKNGGNGPPGGATGGPKLFGATATRAIGSPPKNPAGTRSGTNTGVLMVRSTGSFADTGVFGESETRFPQRPRATFFPSVTTVSPACSVTLCFVQKICSPTR